MSSISKKIYHITSSDGFFISITYYVLRNIIGSIVKFLWVKKVIDLKKIPKKGAAIIAFNHQSYFDFLCFVAVAPRNVHFLSAEKFFTSMFWLPIMKLTGQIKVDRLSKDKRVVHNRVRDHLMAGKLIGIFPEGTRSPDPVKMNYAFTGVAKYAIWHNVPIIPVGIIGTYDVMSRNDKKPKVKKCVEIHVGDPIDLTPYTQFKMNAKAFRAITDKIMLNISILSHKEYDHFGVVHIKKTKQRKKKRVLSIYDFDDTLIIGQSQQMLLVYLKNKGYLTKISYYRILVWFVAYKIGLVKKPNAVMNYAFSFLKGMEVAIFQKEIDQFVDSVLLAKVYQPAIREFEKDIANHNKVIIISNSISPIIKSFAKKHGIDLFFSTRLEEKDGRYTGSIIDSPVYGKRKVELVEGLIKKHKKIKVYSDHHSDLPLFKIATEPIVVNPTKKLLKNAMQNNWKVI